jgi:tetratricopeptide (TPR) repeat protein
MQKNLQRALLLAGAIATLTTSYSFGGTGGLGESHFANSCKPAVQADFEEGVLLLHSFEFKEAERSFRAVEVNDPTCSIAAWGVALAETERSGANAPPQVLVDGWKELQPWLMKPAGSAREQMYLQAVRAMYQDYEHTSPDVRWAGYLSKMEILRRAYPHDLNAGLLYALGLVWTAGTGEKGLAQRREALDVLLPIFQEHPNNPGAAHYIIHAADTPELATIALPAARKYAAIAPDSPHALHMPSHIFNRVGDWQDSIGTNIASARVAEQWTNEGRDARFDELHALNNLEYAYLQLGEQGNAREVIEKIGKLAAEPGGDPWSAVDARIYFDVDTHDWNDAIDIQPPQKSPFVENFDLYWIHSIAAAHLSEPQHASSSLEDFRKSSSEWEPAHGWGDVFHLALLEAQAWTLFSQGKREDAVKQLSEAMLFEKSHPMYYADILPRPAAEMKGDMLFQMGQRAGARRAYEAALEVAPNRRNSRVGLSSCSVPSNHRRVRAQQK